MLTVFENIQKIRIIAKYNFVTLCPSNQTRPI